MSSESSTRAMALPLIRHPGIYISENTGEHIRKVSHSTYLMSTVVDVAGTKSGLDGDLTTCSTTPRSHLQRHRSYNQWPSWPRRG